MTNNKKDQVKSVMSISILRHTLRFTPITRVGMFPISFPAFFASPFPHRKYLYCCVTIGCSQMQKKKRKKKGKEDKRN